MVKADGLVYMAMFILNKFMVKAYGSFPVVIGTFVLYGYFIWFIRMVIVNGILIYVKYN